MKQSDQQPLDISIGGRTLRILPLPFLFGLVEDLFCSILYTRNSFPIKFWWFAGLLRGLLLEHGFCRGDSHGSVLAMRAGDAMERGAQRTREGARRGLAYEKPQQTDHSHALMGDERVRTLSPTRERPEERALSGKVARGELKKFGESLEKLVESAKEVHRAHGTTGDRSEPPNVDY